MVDVQRSSRSSDAGGSEMSETTVQPITARQPFHFGLSQTPGIEIAVTS